MYQFVRVHNNEEDLPSRPYLDSNYVRKEGHETCELLKVGNRRQESTGADGRQRTSSLHLERFRRKDCVLLIHLFGGRGDEWMSLRVEDPFKADISIDAPA